MNITRAGVQQMILAIVSDERFATEGHECGRHEARDLVASLTQWVRTGPPELHIPDGLLPHIDGSVLGHIVAGYGRPLGYLCSDCRYPKWLMTPEEVRRFYPNVKGYLERADNPRPDGFTDVTGGCPVCGD